MQICSQCQGSVSQGATFCSHCGAAVGNIPGNFVSSDPSPERSGGGFRRLLKWGGIGCGGLIVLIIALIVLAAIFSSGNDGSASQEQQARFESLKFEDALSESTTIPYDELFRNNDSYLGQLVHSRGEVVQVVEGWSDDTYDLRVNVTEGDHFWEDTVYLNYSGERLLENDIIEFVGEVKGLKRYDAIFGNTVTVPEIETLKVRVVEKASDR